MSAVQKIERFLDVSMESRNQCMVHGSDFNIKGPAFTSACKKISKAGKYRFIQGCIFINNEYYQKFKNQ